LTAPEWRRCDGIYQGSVVTTCVIAARWGSDGALAFQKTQQEGHEVMKDMKGAKKSSGSDSGRNKTE
jgi:hypothetical protein